MARIHVIDDDVQVRPMVCRALEGLGHEVTAHIEGAAGMAVIAADPPDLVITDVFMPGQDGIVTLLRLRKAFPQLRVVVMSAREAVQETGPRRRGPTRARQPRRLTDRPWFLCPGGSIFRAPSRVAQLVEQPAVNRRVAGSSPASGASLLL